jgi:Lrp/AsnC family transcriptional regulator, regulator for asnA, asnC and gidA
LIRFAANSTRDDAVGWGIHRSGAGSVIREEFHVANALDDLDIRLIELLAEGGRRPTSEIARLVQAPESTVRRRIDRLLNEEVIQVVAVVQDPEALGLPIHANLFFRVAPRDLKGVAEALTRCNELRWIAHMAGEMNLQAEGFFHSPDHLNQFCFEQLSAVEGIQELRVELIVGLVKNRWDWSAMVDAR